MPLALALVLLCGLGGPGAWGCLQCDQSVLLELRQLRDAIVTKRFHLEGLQARAQALLLSMEGPFFRDYAMNAFVGKVVVDQLEKVATSFKNQAQYIKANSKTDVPLLEELPVTTKLVGLYLQAKPETPAEVGQRLWCL
ncbi:izumo sperm-egg fusion protein 2 isoform X5 [Mus musculus]|uniref:izumo sperm-egg fusion protein 2 isoform X5 n=1 Tax=Mus musculus TaxID=10090 RepID=UPI0007EC37D3|nr:izumo sperm-egg fusion protein 2 isoform X5 [Mus musculus]|eukprot:XP_017167850.1 PREDICTED: izumo sperm-egg fusion protein 2 isoform X6 [Mus musculus]